MKKIFYTTPRNFVMSKEASPAGFAIAGHFDDDINTLSPSIEAAKDLARDRAKAMGANGIVEMRVQSRRQSERALNGYISNYTEHVVSGRAVLLMAEGFTEDHLVADETKREFEDAQSHVANANMTFKNESDNKILIPQFGLSGINHFSVIFDAIFWSGHQIINFVRRLITRADR